ncbi:hypothetical protein FEE95_08540 [Maribacter algarum]|uniref:Lipoprotein n=1 Tax=Maribacter algarum (ex Zhang et al. 2020) TaxID=2578118 RepID=A0A5S3PX16_9FLAO|nr:hypothetical protein [Maribacter algarum]TMM59458.1 hypothetical protein FEE95_08540 [Maribacter algarum]
MFRFCPLIIAFLILSCSTDAENILAPTLDSSIASKEVVVDNVIACAASNADDDLISVFFYPRPSTTNFKYYETEDVSVDKNDFENYIPVEFPIRDVFNGFLKKFEVSTINEKWVIVAFDEGGKTHLSNPIRLKQNTKPTEYLSQNVSVEASTNMPDFSWQDGSYSDTKIYFHVVSDATNKLLSGTYTFERNFQYYNLDNVVLNVTRGTPPTLKSGSSYNFTLLGVSEDNWVNLFSEIPFQVE